jgi:cytochrome c5
MPTDPHLIEGRSVWGGTCQACHGLGEAGSPKITDKKAWEPRIAKGLETLHDHALKGFIGPSGTMMPERGGNPELTDTQIFAAVDYMVANSR